MQHPTTHGKTRRPAREAFMFLLMFLTLYISATSFGTLLFQFINRWFPDALQNIYSYDSMAGTIRGMTAALVITFPIFLFISRAVAKEMDHPKRQGSKIRQWLTYLTLFIAAGVIIGDLISLVYTFLSGEITVRFILKIVTILAIAVTVFGYYLWDLRQEDNEETKRPTWFRPFVGGVSLAVIAVLIGGFFYSGTPKQQRLLRLDTQRLNDLQSMSYAMDSYWNLNSRLPQNLDELRNSRDIYLQSVLDPVTQQPYEYRKVDADTYELCATFDLASTDPKMAPSTPYPYDISSGFWKHEAGRKCYALDVRKNPDVAPKIR